MIMRSIFTQASVQLHFLCFCFHLVSLFLFFCFVLFWFFFCFFFCFGFLHHCHCKTTPLQEDIITLTPSVTNRSAVVLLGLPAYAFSLFTILGLSTIAIFDSILAKDVTLDCSKACICFVHWSRHIYFTSWLDNIDKFRCSTAEIASITTMFWTLLTILCQVYAGYLYHHLWSETRQTGYTMGVTVRLESALDLVKKKRSVRRRDTGENHATKAYWRNSPNLQGRFCINLYFIKFVGQNLIY